ncbi:DNA polymerase IV 2 domain protein [Mycobacterium xenopi 4042]|uniref:DNA polymerase IV 2 domain protein n=1 Tax=Mycobacterium xenopi 4042 TaxID=1299334 RepID=X7YQ00_MYCXE|nr:DNA polymerase IV 2 domain protein [Mycobacterium xenopi 4042]
MKKSDMSTLTRSATLPYGTTDAAALVAVAGGCCSTRARLGQFAYWEWGFRV